MSDFYEGRMIPLKIADAAVISCNKEIEKLQIENARLKAEVERLTNCQAEADRLKAEVERLRASSFVTAVPVEEYEKLKAENERLRKAGDALYESEIGYYGEQILVDPKHHSGELCRNWDAAKEGKQS